MCGISVIVSSAGEALQPDIDRMVSVMTHRGPDGRGTFVDRVDESTSVALGHNRLSIIDLTDQAAQPMTSRDGRYVLIYNGEVYNYREIAGELDREDLAPGFGDTAVVLSALARWGPAALAKFNGMWALALYDTHAKTLLLSRDRFGVKPLYVYRDGTRLYLASEIKAILAASGARLPINADVAVPYLTRGLLNFCDETFFRGIRQFAAASYQVVDVRRLDRFELEPIRFWAHPFERGFEPAATDVSIEELQAVFLDAVRLRLRSDVPVGVLLSGGIDSSAIVGAIARAGSLENLTLLSVTSDNPAVNEEPFIDAMARHVALEPQKVNVSRDPHALLDRLGDACWFNDEPICGIADIAELRLMELAHARGLKVLLSGQGADEQLGGYNKFLYFWLMTLVRQGRYGETIATLARFARHSNTLYEFRLSEAIRYIGRKRLATGTFIRPEHADRDTVDIGLNGSYSRRELLDLTRTSIPALLHYEDRMSMSQSVEVRVPFLDVRLVECLARVHPSDKFAGGWSKSIFRKAIDRLVPREIQYRRDKKGFTVPDDDWLKHELKADVTRMFGPGLRAEALGLVDAAALRAAYARFTEGRGYLNGRHFFRVCAFEAFAERYAAHLAG